MPDGIDRIIDLLVINKADNDSLTSVEIGGLDANLRPQFSQVTVAFSGQLIDDKDVEASMNALAPAAPLR